MYLVMCHAFVSNTNGDDGKPDPKKVEYAAHAKKILAALKLIPSGKTAMISFDFTMDELMAYLEERAKQCPTAEEKTEVGKLKKGDE